MRVVICGGGVIGACTAYFLTPPRDRRHRRRTHRGGRRGIRQGRRLPGARLVRRHAARRAGAAKLSRFTPRCADEIAGDWGYRRMTAYSGFVVPERDARRRVPAELDWLSDGVVIAARLGTPETRPRSFTPARSPAP